MYVCKSQTIVGVVDSVFTDLYKIEYRYYSDA